MLMSAPLRCRQTRGSRAILALPLELGPESWADLSRVANRNIWPGRLINESGIPGRCGESLPSNTHATAEAALLVGPQVTAAIRFTVDLDVCPTLWQIASFGFAWQNENRLEW